MTDHELEAKLREQLRTADLPPAPASLRQWLADLPEPTARSGRRRIGGIVLLAAATLAIVGLGVSGVLQNDRLDVIPTIAPSAAPTLTAVQPSPSALDVPVGFVEFEAPGIEFAHPADWVRSGAYDEYPDMLGIRFIGAFARGLTVCPVSDGVEPEPTDPSGCVRHASAPGTALVQVFEYKRQFPGTIRLMGTPTTFAGYEASTPREDVGDTDPIALTWAVAGPDDGLYLFWAEAPNAEIEALRDDMERTLATLRLSSWQEAPRVVDGTIHLDTGQGFSFDYPAGWSTYYPQDLVTGSSAVVSIASRPLEPPCVGDGCQRYKLPSGVAVVEFRVVGSRDEIDWSTAHTTVGGQPAFVHHNEQTEPEAVEGDQMTVRLDADGHTLAILAGYRAPGIDDQREIVGQIIDSIGINAPPP
jgi:hypothetical protein